MKNLYIVRGLPGSGKSTLGDAIAGAYCFAADDFFDEYHDGVFYSSEIHFAHAYCKENVENAMIHGAEDIAVTNTFTQQWEMQPYLYLAEKYGYTVHSIIVENKHGNKSIHNVPEGTIEKMRKRFEVKL